MTGHRWWRPWSPDQMSLWLLENDPSDRRRTHRLRRAVYSRVARSRLLAFFERARFVLARIWSYWFVVVITTSMMFVGLYQADLLRSDLQLDAEAFLRGMFVLAARPWPWILLSLLVGFLGNLSYLARRWFSVGHDPSLVERLFRRFAS